MKFVYLKEITKVFSRLLDKLQYIAFGYTTQRSLIGFANYLACSQINSHYGEISKQASSFNDLYMMCNYMYCLRPDIYDLVVYMDAFYHSLDR